MFKHILVALDGGPQHAQVLALAGSLATPRTRLHLVCVLDPSYALDDDAPRSDTTEYRAADDQRRQAVQLLDIALADLRERGIDAVARHPAGDPAEVLCAQARQHGCDLIVIGHRHLSRVERLFDRSVGQWTIDHAPCPVLVEVRDAGS
ncbi:universal stress protein [Stenotrophomonas rhizophila]|uniref:universal stress protein n=1 Tax=Stenotrophomonas rhizophila TaxID=216778 RepID=UPI001E37E00F|nr:universal stress protein [Stenotrophomonas rhizophila]MCC7633798.1 universal stress protein [Stenotrophomonas rhizophila]MCC7663744.1 universal stress protein [Stenotrophomonas rhizophila]